MAWRLIACSALLVLWCAAASTMQVKAQSGPTVTYAAGWNLVGGATGQTFPQAAGALFTFQAGDSSYETLPNSGPITGGRGYWAYFSTPTTVNLAPSATSSAAIVLPAGQFVMVGNPTAQTVPITGADVVYQFDPAKSQYSTSVKLPPGRGAWALSKTGTTIVLGLAQGTGTPTAPAIPAPGAPQLRATATSATTIRLDWTGGSAAATGYAIYDNGNGQLVDTVPGTVTTYTLQGLSPGVAYCEFVVTLGTAVNSAPSNAVCATTPVS